MTLVVDTPRWPSSTATAASARSSPGAGWAWPSPRRKAAGLAAVALAAPTTSGRLADYAEMAAREGLIGMLWANARGGLNVAPWGGAARRLGTNPHAIAVPGAGRRGRDVARLRHQRGAEGKLRVKYNRKQQAPPGWFMLNGTGEPAHRSARCSTAIRPARCSPPGDHKGYGLSLAVEILGGILSGTGPAGPSNRRLRQRHADDLPRPRAVPAAGRLPRAGGRAASSG